MLGYIKTLLYENLAPVFQAVSLRPKLEVIVSTIAYGFPASDDSDRNPSLRLRWGV